MKSHVLRERHGSTLVIRLNRPQRRNAFDLGMREDLGRAVLEARDDDSVRAVVITGSPGVFCAGGDLKALIQEKRTVFKDRDRVRRLHLWFRELVNLEKPVIAAVDGPAFGAGFNLALACDFIVATPRASFCAAFGRIGLTPDLGGFFLLPRIVGLQRAKDIVFSAREIKAEEAAQLGIVFRIVEQCEIEQNVLALAEQYHAASTEALGLAKNILNRSFNLDQDTLSELEASAIALTLRTSYHEEAVRDFLAKRNLRFDGSVKP